MRHLSSLVSSTAFAAAAALVASLVPSRAAAHIELVEPSPRYTLPSNKSCPCGDGDSNRRCMVTAEESSDPNRSTNVQTFTAGSTIKVVVSEYIDHAGRIRVAFDPDGADLADFNANILEDVSDPAEPGLSMDNPRIWELDVTLPDMTCENCTLQIIQAMHGDTENAVLDPAPLSTYYTCADIRLVSADGEAGGSGDDGAGGSANAGVAGAPGASGAAGGGEDLSGAAGAAGSGGSGAAAAGSGAVSEAEEEEEDSSCSFRPGAGGAAAGWSLALLGLAAIARRRRR